MPVADKMSDYFCDNHTCTLSVQSNGWNIFEGKLFIKTLSTTHLQLICKFMLHSIIIFKCITGPDNACQVDIQA